MERQIDLEQLESILPRYLINAPRYTSYPPATRWSDAFSPEDFQAHLTAARREDADLAVYVHVPFCRRLCHFCACNRIVTRDPDLIERYLATLEAEITTLSGALGRARRASQIHLGGGTPTYLEPPQLERLLESLAQVWRPATNIERSVEADPRVTQEAHLRVLSLAGFDRISLGIQDFDPRVQRAIHREQSFEQVGQVVDSAREFGFNGIGFDLIYGLPFQTEASMDLTLERVLALRPDRIALYSYAHVPWMARQQRGFERKDLPAPALKLRLFLRAMRTLLDAGYLNIGMDHFALPEDSLARAASEGELQRNFMGYTTQGRRDLIGLGPSAISEVGNTYAQSERELAPWTEAALVGGLATMRGCLLSEDDVRRRWLINELLCRGYVSARTYRDRFDADFGSDYAPELQRLKPLSRDGLAEVEADGSVALSPTGRVLMRNVVCVFDAYLSGESQSSAASRFSQTI